MGILNGIRTGLAGNSKSTGAVKAKGSAAEAIAGLDTMGAIEAHIRWKVRLEAYLSGSGSEKLDPAVVEQDNQCVLGKWIHGAGGEQYHGSPMVVELTETHAAFHKCVAEIVRKADRGEITEATNCLHNGEYSKLSYRIKTQLARLCLAANKAQASG
jgi:hypothetical protein